MLTRREPWIGPLNAKVPEEGIVGDRGVALTEIVEEAVDETEGKDHFVEGNECRDVDPNVSGKH